MNVCKDCTYYVPQKDGQNGVCWRNPPTPVLMGQQQDLSGRNGIVVQGFRPPVSNEERACGEFKSHMDAAPMMPWNRAAN